MCGILGIIDNIPITPKYFLFLLSKIQHRGQEGFGIAWKDKDKIDFKKFINKIEMHNSFNYINNSNMFIGHVRYSTSGKSKQSLNYSLYDELQPIKGKSKCGDFILVHNGNLPDYLNLANKDNFNLEGKCEDIASDTDLIVKLIESLDKDNWNDLLITLHEKLERAYCLLIMTKDKVYVLRDSYGVRPLCIGYNETGWCVSSESVVFNDYNFLRDVRPGEIIKIDTMGIKTIYLKKQEKKARCLFEYIYFLNENSYQDDYQVSKLRYQYGSELAKQDLSYKFSLENPLVVGSPTTGIPSGKGYADKMRWEYSQVLKKNIHIGRTFILENNKKREDACRKKYYLETEKIKDRNIVIVDDSLVRGTTITNLIKIFRESKAKSVHVRIAAPPIKYPCYYGIDIPTKEELIANHNNIKRDSNSHISIEVGKLINADSLYYLDIDNIKKVMNDFSDLCTGCFNNNYNDLDW